MKKMALILSVLTISAIVYSQDISEQAKSLKGLKAVSIEVDIASLSTAERYGLRAYEIAKKMEQMLVENGIEVIAAKESESDPNMSILRIYITPMIDEKNDACSISVDMTLRQTIRLNSNPSVIVKDVGTWRQNAVSLINAKLLLPAVSERVDTYLKLFIVDWCWANGRKNPYESKKNGTSI